MDTSMHLFAHSYPKRAILHSICQGSIYPALPGNAHSHILFH